jgi:uncharacterized protein YkwD
MIIKKYFCISQNIPTFVLNITYMKYLLLVKLLIISNLVYSQDTQVIGETIFSLVKQIRKDSSINSEIVMNQTLCKVARIQAEYILNSGNFTHDNPNSGYTTVDDRVRKFGFRSGANENLTYLNYSKESSDSLGRRAISNFMKSPPHRYTLLSGDELNTPVKTAYGQSILYDMIRQKIIIVQVYVQCDYPSDLLMK